MERNSYGVIGGIMQHPISFAVSFVLFFCLMYVVLASADILPETSPTAPNEIPESSSEEVVEATPELPVRIAAPAVGVNALVSNPESTNIATLDAALLTGAVRYPTTAKLGEEGTMLVFAHSSRIPVVHNQAYKAFNNIQNLKKGETISVYSAEAEYRYKVTNVRIADATEDVIQLAQSGKHLVLVTCDSFTSKSSRFVVTAELVGTYSLTN
jgi:LPXTG-site transpeptidase (sortase) family protein